MSSCCGKIPVHGVHKVFLQLEKSLVVLLNAAAEFVNRLLLKNPEKHFCNSTFKTKNFVKHIENLRQHLSEKLIGDNLSIIDIAFVNLDISIIVIALGFFQLSIIVIALVHKGLSCPSLRIHTVYA